MTDTNIFGLCIQDIRREFSLTQRDLAAKLGVDVVQVTHVETGESAPSPEFCEAFKAVVGIDLHVMAWAMHGDVGRLPAGLRKSAGVLTDDWRERVREALDAKRGEDD